MNNKTILLIGALSEPGQRYTYATSIFNTLSKMDMKVSSINSKKNYLLLNTTSLNVLTARLKIINNFLINKKIKKSIATTKPDLVFIIKGENITHKTIKYIKKYSNAPIVQFYPDNPFCFWNGVSNKNVLQSLPLIDYFLIWSKMLLKPLHAAGCKSVHYFPFAFDPTVFKPIKINQKNKYDVSFVGSWDKQREWWLTRLVEKLPTLKLGIWGNRWHDNLNIQSPLGKFLKGKAVYPPDSINIFTNSTINLNFIRTQNITAHNMRTFELPACKSFMLTQRSHEQIHELFTENKHVVCFETIDELAEKTTYYLSHEAERLAMAQAAHRHVQQYTLEKQLNKLLSSLRL